MNTRFPTTFAGLLAMLIVLTGCSTARMYSGPAQPQDQVAVLYRHANYVDISKIDGQAIPLTKRVKVLELLPGQHTIECTFRAEYMDTGYTSDTSGKGVQLTFEAKAGYTYWVDSNIDPFSKQWHPRVIGRPSSSQEPTKP